MRRMSIDAGNSAANNRSLGCSISVIRPCAAWLSNIVRNAAIRHAFQQGKRPCFAGSSAAHPIDPTNLPRTPGRGGGKYSSMGRAVHTADAPLSLLRCGPARTSLCGRSPHTAHPCVRRPTASQRRDFDSPSGLRPLPYPCGKQSAQCAPSRIAGQAFICRRGRRHLPRRRGFSACLVST